MTGCLVCQEQSGVIAVPGGHLQADDRVVVFHLPVLEPATDVFAGYLLVTPRRHVAGFAGLTDHEAAAVGVAIAQWSRALAAAGAEHVYVLRVGHGVAHLHVHLVPRWPGTPADVPWTAVDEWSGARRCDHDGAARMAEQLRACAAQCNGPPVSQVDHGTFQSP